MPSVMVISPPFASHAAPMARLAAAMTAAGADVIFACDPAFAGLAAENGVSFAPLSWGDGANTGIAQRTTQSHDAHDRLREFVDSTRLGAVSALLTQAQHRQADMLPSPEETLEAVRMIDEEYRPDWYVVDQLAYAVTLALHCLALPWATFCPGHPSYVVHGDNRFFGLPAYWPDAVRPGAEALAEVEASARDNDRVFTGLFADFISTHAPEMQPPSRAFALTSSRAVVFNYPDLPWLPELPAGPAKIFVGHCGTAGPYIEDTPPLPHSWRDKISRLTDNGRRKLVLVSFGTFLSARDDVLRVVTEGALLSGDVAVVVSGGDRVAALADLADAHERVSVEPTVPQRALLPHVDVVVHHGGNNSFTEALAAGVPALVLPFSSDQFAIAHDVVRAGAGLCLDPHGLVPRQVAEVLLALFSAHFAGFAELVTSVRASGPSAGAAELLTRMGNDVPSRLR